MFEEIPVNCAGCGLCAAVCPTHAIEMRTDNEGFLIPEIDELKCIKCDSCENSCIVLHPNSKRNENTSVYAAFNLDDAVRLESTSGGVFSLLAEDFLRRTHGIVVGAAYTDAFDVEHIAISEVEDICKIRQSKYIQSDMTQIYHTLDKVRGQRAIMFAGTPCQVAAAARYTSGWKQEIIYIDFICRGVNSPLVFHKYLKNLENQYNSKIIKVWFKNKEYGWNKFHTRIEFANGEVYSADRYNDAFMRGFLKHNLYMRESCFDCKYKGVQRQSDITLADFWGVHLSNPDADIEKGVSAVIVHSDTGRRLLAGVEDRLYLEEKQVSDVIKGNVCINESVIKKKDGIKFWKQLNDNNFVKLIKEMEE